MSSAKDDSEPAPEMTGAGADSDSTPGGDSKPQSSTPEQQEPGCMPIVVACTLLMGIVSFVFCGVTTWVLFQKRTEVAIRTLVGYVDVIEQSLLPPDEKKSVIAQLESTIKEMRADDYPQERASAVMQRLVRLPIPQYGELDVIDSFVQENFGDDERNDALKQISRLRRAIELGKATVIDVNDVLLPTTQVDTTHPLGRVLKQPLAAENIREVVQRAKLIGDREKLADQPFERKPIDEILKRELTAAVDQGGF
ncbi:MAG TPA: hypothetical protein DDX19_15255 [Rhodopirellula baltica]|uniref:Transmembrane protein n=1 Tax=Rhodopirellula baltica (strain DSM 10527 / NCIMB 13988 / SH1) TaxID=243090 RepID=Q7UV99_RHOBA|nr:hypothetical protein [Rhodopirellula baltica]CAD72827.1 hypothetical protein-transmembrane prediction [Rhodopirellula baltica SH 1]HBE64063.1 hypothetical protein [Rhodopirellula baltica]